MKAKLVKESLIPFETGDEVKVGNRKGVIMALPTAKNPKYGKIALVSFEKGGNEEINLDLIEKI
jgi:hypothetical protein